MWLVIHLFFRTPSSVKRSKSQGKFVIESDDDDAPLHLPAKLGKHGELLAPCGRPAFSANPVNKKYNSRYRNPENQKKLGGKLLELGRAVGIVSFTLFGFDVSLEAAHAANRLRIFKSASWYALTDAEVKEIMEHTEAQVDDYIKGIVTAGLRLLKYQAGEEVYHVVYAYVYPLLYLYFAAYLYLLWYFYLLLV